MKRYALLFAAFWFALIAPAQAQSMADGSAASGELSFAEALTVHDDVVAVGEPDHLHVPGLVYVFHEDEDGTWTEQHRLQAEDGEVGDGFGSAVAADRDRIVVGAPNAAPNGAAYAFGLDATEGWVQLAKLTAPEDAEGFGESVTLSGDRIFVGADAGNNGEGAVHVYERDGGTWSLTATLMGSDAEDGDRFAATLAAQEDHLLVGAPSKDNGSVYPYRYHADEGEWVEGDRLAPGALSSNARLGTSLHLHDGQLLVGAPRQMDGMGSVFAFEWNGSEWSSDGQLMPFDGTTNHRFGSAVAFDGMSAWVGAPGADSRTGAVYQFKHDDETNQWTTAERTVHPEAESGDHFGSTLSASASTVGVGLTGAQYGAGKAAAYTLHAGEWTSSNLFQGAPDAGLAAITGEEHTCEDGEIGPFECENVDLLSFLPIHEFGGERGVSTNDVWGWTDPETNNEIALVGRTNGLAFVDVTDPTNPVFLGDLPKTEGAQASSWRDAKVYNNHAFVVSDNAGDHGMQVFDLTRLRDIDEDDNPATFEPDHIYDRVGSSHNIEVNTETGFAYIVGTSSGEESCGGGLHMVDISDPMNPEFQGCFADEETGRANTGYTHDAQCTIYEGPDERYQGQEICFGSNETAISIADVTDKENPVALSRGTYPNAGYVHQGWLSEDHEYFYLNDELDELNNLVENTRTLIWDVSDLEDPQLVEEFFHETTASTHNKYVVGDTQYQSNYNAGLRVLDISDRTNPEVTGYFDTAPHQEGPGFSGTWSNYPFFESGTVLVNSINEGLFMLRPQDERPQL